MKNQQIDMLNTKINYIESFNHVILDVKFYIEKEINFWQNNMNSYYFSLFDETFFTSLL
jgi:hypothetical protein